MSKPSEQGKDEKKESPLRQPSSSPSSSGALAGPSELPVAPSPQRPVLNRKASGLKFNQHFSFEKVIGSYRIVKKIGKGRFGVVKLGEHVTSGSQVAIKIVDKSGLNVVESNSIKTEAEVMTCLNHPNVVRLLEVIETKYELALIMEYAAGGDLFEYVQKQKRKLTEKEVRSLFVQVVAGLSYCHRHWVVHRDIKAENILLDGDGNVRIGDWGFSSVFHPGSAIETACGSLDYAAPEVLTGLVSYGPSVDIWSLGVLLYFLLTARLPFNAPNDFDVYTLIKSAEYKCPKGLSRECKALLRALLNPNAQTRISISEVERCTWFTANLDIPHTSHHHSSHSQAASSSVAGHSFKAATSSSEHKKPPSPRSGLPLNNPSPPSSLQLPTSKSHASKDKENATGSTHVKRKKRSTKEKRSISDTKIEQSMHKLKAGSGQATKTNPRASGGRRTAEKRFAGSGYSPVNSDPFNTITEEEDEEVMNPDTSDDEVQDEWAPSGEFGTGASISPSSRTPPTNMPTLLVAGSSPTTANGLSSSGDNPRSGAETPGRLNRKRSFNTEKTKAELAVSRFIILKLSASQLDQLRLMSEFDILQVTTKTTTKDEAIHTVVVATKVVNSRKLLRKFEQTRRLFRWNSDTHFGLRSRFKTDATLTPLSTPQPTPPVTPKRHSSSFRAATTPPDPVASPSNSPSSSSSNVSQYAFSRARSTSRPNEVSDGTLSTPSPSSSSHSPTTARRRRKSINDPAANEPTSASIPSPLSRGHARSQNASPNRPSVPRVKTTARGKLAKMHSWSQSEFDNAAPGTLKKQMVATPQSGAPFFRFFKKKRSGSKSSDDSPTSTEEGNKVPTPLVFPESSATEEDLPTTPSKPSLTQYRARHTAVEMPDEEDLVPTEAVAPEETSPKKSPRLHRSGPSKSSDHHEEKEARPSSSSAAWIHSHTMAPEDAPAVQAAPGSSPAKINSPSKLKHKKSRHLDDAVHSLSFDASPRNGSNSTQDTSTEEVGSSPDSRTSDMYSLATSKKQETQSQV